MNPEPLTWLNSLSRENAIAAAAFGKLDIKDDADYLLHEHKLDGYTRQIAGLYRFKALGGYESLLISDFLDVAPPWFLDKDILDLETKPSYVNSLRESGCYKVKDLMTVPPKAFAQLPSMGKKAFKILIHDMVKDLESGFLDSEEELIAHTIGEEKEDRKNSWFETLNTETLAIHRAFREFDIKSDDDYLAREHEFDEGDRISIGIYRFKALGGHMCSSVKDTLEVAPPWFLEKNLDTIDDFPRCKSVFEPAGYHKVSDLRHLTYEDLIGLPKMGVSGAKRLPGVLIHAILSEIPSEPETLQFIPYTPVSVFQDFGKAIEVLNEQQKKILLLRLGLGGEYKTLQEIADLEGLSRQRIDQVINMASKKLAKKTPWLSSITMRLNRLMENRETPLLLSELMRDPWLYDIDKFNTEAINIILSQLQKTGVNLLRLDQYVSDIDKLKLDKFGIVICRMEHKELKSLIGEARAKMNDSIGSTYDECRVMVERMLPDFATELKDPFWRIVSQNATFLDEEHQFRLIYTNQSFKSEIFRVMHESETPLHASEVFRRVTAGKKKKITMPHVRNMLLLDFILINSSVFALPKHLHIDPQEKKFAIRFCEDISSTSNRQWHTSELVKMMKKENPNLKLDKYTLDHVLKGSKKLRSLKRMIWINKALSSKETRRIPLNQTIKEILEDAGVPLPRLRLIELLKIKRGLDKKTILEFGPQIIKLPNDHLGLLGRDELPSNG